jgi:hypothetical protein
MSILDDAIREHLELKRAHGADEAELKKLEDEAFGPSGRPEEPDPFAEAPTQFMATEGAEDAESASEEGGRRINVADLQEPPPPEQAGQREEPQVESVAAVEPDAGASPTAPAEDPVQAAPPAEEAPAMEREIVSEPPESERHAIAEQPTELFDVEAEMGDDAPPAAETPSPSDEEIAAAELSEPKLAPAEPATEIHASRADAPAEPAEEDEEDEEFWSDQRLSEELDQALEAPITDDSELPPLTDEHEVPPPAAESSAPTAEPDAVYQDAATEGERDEEDGQPNPDYDPDTGHEDVLEDTPDFLEDAPEDDELWFEQKPPKDFDFDD